MLYERILFIRYGVERDVCLFVVAPHSSAYTKPFDVNRFLFYHNFVISQPNFLSFYFFVYSTKHFLLDIWKKDVTSKLVWPNPEIVK